MAIGNAAALCAAEMPFSAPIWQRAVHHDAGIRRGGYAGAAATGCRLLTLAFA
jgi:hypothetical protein